MATTLETLRKITEEGNWAVIERETMGFATQPFLLRYDVGQGERKMPIASVRAGQNFVDRLKRQYGPIQLSIQVPRGVGEGEVPTWHVKLDAGKEVAGFKLSIEGFASGGSPEEAQEDMLKEIAFMLANSASWTPWNVAAKGLEGIHSRPFKRSFSSRSSRPRR